MVEGCLARLGWETSTGTSLDKLEFEVWTDASLAGLGGHLGGLDCPLDTFLVTIPTDLLGNNIMFYKVLALVHALREWVDLLDGSWLIAYVHNTVLLHAIKTGSCRH
jgi:hypothetical protein